MKIIKPYFKMVLIKPDEVESVTKSGIIIPDTAKEKPKTGTVVSRGEGTDKYKMTVSEGSSVLYLNNYGIEIELDGAKYILIDEQYILGEMQ